VLLSFTTELPLVFYLSIIVNKSANILAEERGQDRLHLLRGIMG
jgi:hypothetical protein